MAQEHIRVCIIEDDADTADLLRDVCTRAWPTATVFCTVCADVESALRELVKVRFDVITMDLFLPKLSGLAALSLVHGYAPITPIVVISGADVTLDHMEQYGVVLTVTKPFKLRPLSETLARIVAQAPATTVEPVGPRELLSQGILSYRLLYNLFLELPDAVLVTDGTTILACNKAAPLLFGYHTSELLGRPIDMLVPPSARHAHTQGRLHYLLQPSPRQLTNLVALHKHGGIFTVDITLHPYVELVGLRILVTICRVAESVAA